MKVFYSWQSDRPQAVCRTFIKEAVEEALERIHADLKLDESDRPEIDHDTKDVGGTIDITNTILGKIVNCAVFVGDITPVARSDAGKEVANPNVLIELGYALHAKGDGQIVLIANTAYGAAQPEKLPFNLRHKRGPAAYKLIKDADEDVHAQAKAELVDELVVRLGACLKNVGKPRVLAPSWRTALPGDNSIWFERGAVLKHQGFHGGAAAAVTLDDGPRSYIRLLPSSWSKGLPTRDQVHHAPAPMMLYPLGRAPSADGGLTFDGALIYSITDLRASPRVTTTLAQWFRDTGEIWGIDGAATELHNKVRWVPSAYLMERWAWFLARGLSLYKHFGARAPVSVKIGMTGIGDTTISSFNRDSIDAEFEYGGIIQNYSPAEQVRILTDANNKLREVFGLPAVGADPVIEMVGQLVFKG
jgi:hypothetical protein